MNSSYRLRQNTAPSTISLTVPDEARGERLDKFLGRLSVDRSRVMVQRCIADQLVLINDAPAAVSRRLCPGDIITVTWPPEEDATIVPQPVSFDIVYEDADLLVVDKPPGLVVHPTRNQRQCTLVHGLLYYDNQTFASMLDSEMRPGIVHRLDKETSGLMVVAKNPDAWSRMKHAFKQRTVEKKYLALVVGDFGATSGRIETLIGRHPRNRKKMAVVRENGKLATTGYRVIATSESATLLEVVIETGRTHQIRVHFAELNHPVLGDRVYGGRKKIPGVEPDRQMLHSWRLAFPHPGTGVIREFTAAIPRDFRQIMRKLELCSE